MLSFLAATLLCQPHTRQVVRDQQPSIILQLHSLCRRLVSSTTVSFPSKLHLNTVVACSQGGIKETGGSTGPPPRSEFSHSPHSTLKYRDPENTDPFKMPRLGSGSKVQDYGSWVTIRVRILVDYCCLHKYCNNSIIHNSRSSYGGRHLNPTMVFGLPSRKKIVVLGETV